MNAYMTFKRPIAVKYLIADTTSDFGFLPMFTHVFTKIREVYTLLITYLKMKFIKS